MQCVLYCTHTIQSANYIYDDDEKCNITLEFLFCFES